MLIRPICRRHAATLAGHSRLGILVAPTGFGQGVLDVVGELVSGINGSSR